MDEKEVNLLKADLLKSYELIERVYQRISKQQATFRDSIEAVDSMAYQLHNIYGTYEELFEVVAGFFENQIGGARYHADLLRRMGTRIEGMRPALLSSSTAELLDELRRFHHFVRHAYAAKLDADRIGRIVQIALDLKEPFRQDMENFLAQLR